MSVINRTSTSVPHTPSLLNNEHESIQLHRSTETALLWSSGGIKSIILNQWKSTTAENESALTNTFIDSATLHCSLSQALRLTVYPYFRPAEIDSSAAGVTASKDGKGKGTTSTSKKARSPSPKGKQQPAPSKETHTNKKLSSVHPTNGGAEQSSLAESKEEAHRPTLQLQQLNMVMFGLPNLTFTP